MKTTMLTVLLAMIIATSAWSQGYKVGDKASDFHLKNIDGKYISLKDYRDAKGFIVVFTCNHCPFAKAYQQRIGQLDAKYKSRGFPVIAINPNDPAIEPEDSYANMISLASEKGFTYPYLFDESQDTYRMYGAKRTPHVFLLQKRGPDLIVKYIGAIDDNSQDASKVSSPWLANAVDNLLSGKDPDPSVTKAIGCSIKDSHPLNP